MLQFLKKLSFRLKRPQWKALVGRNNKQVLSKYFSLGGKLFLLLLGLMISLILAEMLFRIFPKFRIEYDLNRFKTNNPVVEDLNLPDWIPRFRPSSILGYEFVPNSAPDINSYGMIGKEYGLKKSKNTFRILVLGDSITQFDWYVRSVEERLNNSSNLNYNFELWNAGVVGYEVNQYANYLKFKGIKYSPNMVIIGFCLNDFNISYTLITCKDANGFIGYAYSGGKLPRKIPINNFLFGHSCIYRYIFISIDNLLTKINSEQYINERVKTGSVYLEEIKKVCQRKRIALLTIIFPYLVPLNEYRQFEAEEYRSMVKVLKDLDIDYIDLHDFFPIERIKSLGVVKGDRVHPSKEGHEIAAKAIYDYLIEKYFSN